MAQYGGRSTSGWKDDNPPTISMEFEIARLKEKIAKYPRTDEHYKEMVMQLEARQKELWQYKYNRAAENVNDAFEQVKKRCIDVSELRDVEEADPTKFRYLKLSITEFLSAHEDWVHAKTAPAT